MRRQPAIWKSAIYYGEVIGFFAAWIVGIAVLSQYAPEPGVAPAWDRLATADAETDSLSR